MVLDNNGKNINLENVFVLKCLYACSEQRRINNNEEKYGTGSPKNKQHSCEIVCGTHPVLKISW